MEITVNITKDMIEQAKVESEKRNPFIIHHFDVKYLSGRDRDVIGFLGEFACCEYLGIDWKSNIRDSYLTIDSGDIIKSNLVLDVKTETIPNESPYYNFNKVIKRMVDDDKPYGRRLIVEGQVGLLDKYDIVVFGAFERGNYNTWYGLGYLETSLILSNYQVTKTTPFGRVYPEPALPIKTSELKSLSKLKT